jgi:hypothetical protein
VLIWKINMVKYYIGSCEYEHAPYSTFWSTLLSSYMHKFLPRLIFEKCRELQNSILISCLHKPNPILSTRFIIPKIILPTNRQWSSTTFKAIFWDSKHDIFSQWEWWTPQGRNFEEWWPNMWIKLINNPLLNEPSWS